MICAVRPTDEHSIITMREILQEFRPEFHRFGTFEQLVTLAARQQVDLVHISCMDNVDGDVPLLRQIRSLPLLSFIPLFVQHPHPSAELIQELLDTRVDEILIGPLTDPPVAARMRVAVERTFRDINVNPSSHLPGPSMIERVLRQSISDGKRFAVCYADLDDFKAYNDYYGYFSGDHVIKMTAQIIRDVVYRHEPSGFVGHIAGDDFIFVIDSAKVKMICKQILKEFDRRVPEVYEPRDLKNGFIISKNRRGAPETYPIMSLSIAVVINKDGMFQHVGEISHMIADLKHYAKSLPGSNYVIERRQKY